MTDRPDIVSRGLLPAVAFIYICVVTAGVWWILDTQREARTQRMIEASASELAAAVRGDIRARIPALRRIASRWERRGGTPHEEFLEDVRAHISDMPGFQALEWVDAGFYVRWVVPLEGNEEAVGLNLAAEERRRAALETARHTREPTMTGPVDLVQGGKGFLIYFPVFAEGEFDGFILAAFRAEDWLNFVFSFRDNSAVGGRFVAAVEIDGEPVFSQVGWAGNNWEARQGRAEFRLMDHDLAVAVRPTAEFFRDGYSSLPEIAVAGGILQALLISVLIYLYQRASAAAREARYLSETLKQEVEQRESAQQELRLAHGELQERVRESSLELSNTTKRLNAEMLERQRAEYTARASEERARRSALFDQLTELPNGRLLRDRLARSIAMRSRSADFGAVLFVDLDDFETVNELWGFTAGDEVLIEVARRLKACACQTDTVARLCADQFVIILDKLGTVPNEAEVAARNTARSIFRALAEPFTQCGGDYQCVASIGIHLFNDPEASVDDVLRAADAAMRQARAGGTNLFQLFKGRAGPLSSTA